MQSATAHQDDERLINVAIPKPLHRQAKAAAALSGVTLQEFVQSSIRSALPANWVGSQQNGKNPNSVPVETQE